MVEFYFCSEGSIELYLRFLFTLITLLIFLCSTRFDREDTKKSDDKFEGENGDQLSQIKVNFSISE